MRCFDCKKPTVDAVWYEAHCLCVPCYQVWQKADEEAIKS